MTLCLSSHHRSTPRGVTSIQGTVQGTEFSEWVKKSCGHHLTDLPLETATKHAQSLRGESRTPCRPARPLRWPSRRARVQHLSYRLHRNLKHLFHLVVMVTLNVATVALVALVRELICALHNRVQETINRFESRTRVNEDQSLEMTML